MLDIKSIGALAFGMIIGWYVYYVNRYRKGDVQFSDITTLVGAIGGGALLKLFDPADATKAISQELFGWYGLGLAVGFFGYFLVLIALVNRSENFFSDWFLDGRRKNPSGDYGYGADVAGTVRTMSLDDDRHTLRSTPATTQTFYVGTGPAGNLAGDGATPTLAASSNVDQVKDCCKRLLPTYAGDCSGFVKAVCSEFGVTLTGQANSIVDQLTPANGWTDLGSGTTAGKNAADAAERGLLVVGGRKEIGNGHVVVVVRGTPHLGRYPHAYWGKLGDPDNAGYDRTVNWAWDSNARDSVTYASRSV